MLRSPSAITAGLLVAALIGGAAVYVGIQSGLIGAHQAVVATPLSASFSVGRAPTPEEVSGWDIDIRPDGHGLPVGKGSVAEGETVYNEQCASCHGEFGESAGRWPMLAGGADTLASNDPVKTVGSYWPYASTLMDYIRRAMPYGNAQTLSNDQLYAVTAFILYLNDIIEDEAFELSNDNFASIKMPNQDKFIDDNREIAEQKFWQHPCMTNCAPDAAKITGRARVIDVTPEAGTGPAVD